MEDIQTLHNKIKDVIKQADISLDALIENIKSRKEKLVMDVSVHTALKNAWNIDLVVIEVMRKLVILSIKLQRDTKKGTDTMDKVLCVHHFQNFVEYVQKEHKEFCDRSLKKMESQSESMSQQYLVKLRIFENPFV